MRALDGQAWEAQTQPMTPTTSHRILRRLAGRIRLAALDVDDRAVATKLLLIATELEDMAQERRDKTARRN